MPLRAETHKGHRQTPGGWTPKPLTLHATQWVIQLHSTPRTESSRLKPCLPALCSHLAT